MQIVVAIVNVNEYTDSDQNGQFRIIDNRREVNVTTKIPLRDIKVAEFDCLIRVMWFISQVFVKVMIQKIIQFFYRKLKDIEKKPQFGFDKHFYQI